MGVTSDVNDGEILNVEPRLLVNDAETRLSFLEDKNEPEPSRDSNQTSSSRVEILGN